MTAWRGDTALGMTGEWRCSARTSSGGCVSPLRGSAILSIPNRGLTPTAKTNFALRAADALRPPTTRLLRWGLTVHCGSTADPSAALGMTAQKGDTALGMTGEWRCSARDQKWWMITSPMANACRRYAARLFSRCQTAGSRPRLKQISPCGLRTRCDRRQPDSCGGD